MAAESIRLDDLEETVKALADRQAIWQAYSTLYDALDYNDVEAFVGCFTETGSIYTGGRGTFTGRRALEQYIPDTADGRPSHHFANFRVLDLGASMARATARYVLVSNSSGALYARGRTEGDLSRSPDGTWRFKAARFVFEWVSDEYVSLGRGALDPEND